MKPPRGRLRLTETKKKIRARHKLCYNVKKTGGAMNEEKHQT